MLWMLSTNKVNVIFMCYINIHNIFQNKVAENTRIDFFNIHCFFQRIIVYLYTHIYWLHLYVLDPVPLPLVQQKTEISFGTRQDDLITNDDMQYNCPQWYHAYVLYAKEDKDFVDVLLQKMRDKGLKVEFFNSTCNSSEL